MLLLPTTRRAKEWMEGREGGFVILFIFLFTFCASRTGGAMLFTRASPPCVCALLTVCTQQLAKGRRVWGGRGEGRADCHTDRPSGPRRGREVAVVVVVVGGANILPAWPLGRAVCPRFSASLMRLIGSESRRKARLNCIPFITRPYKSAIICIRLHIQLRSG